MRRAALLPFLAAAAAVVSGCSSPLVAKVAPALSTAPRSYFVRVAEALTAPSLTEEMRVAPRSFSAYQIMEACRVPRRVSRLEAPTRTVSLRPGERLTLSTLRIVAVDDANLAVAGVPVVIEAEELNPPVIQLRSDDPDIEQGRLLAVGNGTFRMRVRTLCSATNVEMTLTGTVATPALVTP